MILTPYLEERPGWQWFFIGEYARNKEVYNKICSKNGYISIDWQYFSVELPRENPLTSSYPVLIIGK